MVLKFPTSTYEIVIDVGKGYGRVLLVHVRVRRFDWAKLEISFGRVAGDSSR